MSVTEQIIEVVERGRALGLSDADLDEMLFAIGCIRVVHWSDELIAYYNDEDGRERFVVCMPDSFERGADRYALRGNIIET